MKTLIFDLDNTLYAADSNLFGLIDVRINRFMAGLGIDEAEVDRLRREYWEKYGVTLQGLIRHHEVDPEEYLHYVHDVDIPSRIDPDHQLRDTLMSLDQRKVVFTNGCRNYAGRVLDALEIEGCFDEIYDIRVADYQPKPFAEPYQQVLNNLCERAEDCVMIEDMPINLQTAKELGMRTVLVGKKEATSFVDVHIREVGDISKALQQLG